MNMYETEEQYGEYKITVFITDVNKPLIMDQDTTIILGKEMLLRGDTRARASYPFMALGRDMKGVTCDMIIGKGKIYIHLPFHVRPGDGQDEVNEVLDNIFIKPYIKLMAKHFGLIHE